MCSYGGEGEREIKRDKQCILSHRNLDTVQSTSDYLLFTVRGRLIFNLFRAFWIFNIAIVWGRITHDVHIAKDTKGAGSGGNTEKECDAVKTYLSKDLHRCLVMTMVLSHVNIWGQDTEQRPSHPVTGGSACCPTSSRMSAPEKVQVRSWCSVKPEQVLYGAHMTSFLNHA